MTLLNIFHTGGLTLGLTIVWLALAGWMGYQAFIAHKSGGTDQEPDGIVYDDEKTPYHKIPQFLGSGICNDCLCGCFTYSYYQTTKAYDLALR